MCSSPVTLWRQHATIDGRKTDKVPCGKCHKCLGKRRNDWSFRLYHEMQISESACFMTLTYGHHPTEEWGEDPPTSFNGIYTLKKRDLQLFLKKLRKKNSLKLKYYAVGEYGTNNYRPHYHLILFNLDRHLLCRSHYLAREIWQKGNIDIALCNIATINYTAGYVMQGSWKPQTDDDDREPQFSTSSKNLGLSYLTDELYNYHIDRLEPSVLHPSGFRIKLPRYYYDRIFSKLEKKEINEINRKIQEVDWEDFINVDYKKEREIFVRDSTKHFKNLKTKRAVL